MDDNPTPLTLIEDLFIVPKDCIWTVHDELNESLVDGIHILARVSGPFFIVNGSSQNLRYYSDTLWRRALNESADALNAGTMVGTISHQQPLDDQAFLEGKISHKITKLWINEAENLGYGELLILNTKVGRSLNAYLRGGIKLSISSRALGRYNGKMGKSDIIDASTFVLEGFDFVRVPGVLQAAPRIVEHQTPTDLTLDITETNLGNFKMADEELKTERKRADEALANLSTAKSDLSIAVYQVKDLQGKIDEAAPLLAKIAALGGSVGIDSKLALLQQYESFGAPKEITSVNESLTTTVSKLDTVSTDLTQTRESLIQAQAELSRYHQLGTVDEVMQMTTHLEELALGQGTVTTQDEELLAYRKLGSVVEVERVIGIAEAYVASGVTVAGIESLMDVVESYETYGSLDELDALTKVAESYVALGTPSEIDAALAMTETYMDLGSVTELTRVMSVTESLITAQVESASNKVAGSLASHYGVDASIVKGMLDKMPEALVNDTLAALKASEVSERYVKPAQSQDVAAVNESRDIYSSATRAERLMKQYK